MADTKSMGGGLNALTRCPLYLRPNAEEASMVARIGVSVLTLGLLLSGSAVSQDFKSAADRTTPAVLPTYQLLGFPISPAQAQVLMSAHVEEMPPAPTLTVGGMPASPHQIAVLRPRPLITQAATASKR